MQRIKELNIKPVKKQAAEQKDEIKLIKDFGPEGDAYGAPGERQITLLGEEDISILDKDREKGICINRFVPNITISNSTSTLIKGQTYNLGKAVIRISETSKICHEGCQLIEEEKRICLLPRAARFASILKSDIVKVNDPIKKTNL